MSNEKSISLKGLGIFKEESDNAYQPKGDYQPAGSYATTAQLEGKVDKETGKGLSTNDYTNGDKAKVAAALTQHQDISGKVDKIAGKGLSTNDYTNADKTKVAAALTQHQDISGKANTSDVEAALALKADKKEVNDTLDLKANRSSVYTKEETYSKTEVNGLVDTPHQEYVTVDTYTSLPATGSKDTVYRVSNYNGSTSQVDASVYSEYAWDGTKYVFLCVKSQIGEVFDITAYNNNTKYADLAAALGTGGEHVPESLRKGGMSIKFVQSSDNKYVQYRLMSAEWSTTGSDWQGVDDEPTAGSYNMVKSGGVEKLLGTHILKGKGSTYVSSFIKLIKGRTYRLVLDNPSWLRDNTGTDSTEFIFNIISSSSSIENILTYVYRGDDTGTVSKYYDFVVPDDCDYIRVGGRANIGEEIVFNLFDISYTKDVEERTKEYSKKIGFYLEGNDADYVTKTYMGIIPGHTYIVSVNPIIWAHTQADTLSDKTSTGFRLYLENIDGSVTNIVFKTIEQYNQVLSSYTFVAPENINGTLVCVIRADIGEIISISVVEKFFENDIYEAQKRLEYAENISSNILCLETSTDNRFINRDGNIVVRDNRISDYIYCKGQQYISGSYKDGNVAFYDKDLKLLSAASQESGVVNIPQNAYYVRVTFSHYKNNDYFIFGNNPNLTTDDYVPYGTVINKENAKWVDDRKNFEVTNGNCAFSSFYCTGEHSSNNDRLYINIPAGSICTINVNAEKEIGNVAAACYVEYSDGEREAITSTLIDKNVFTNFSAVKDIVSIGFYVYAPSYKGRIYESVKISIDVDIEGLPLYWSNYMKTRMPDIHLQEEDTAFNGDMFIFFTDYHLEHNSGYSHQLMKYIVDRTHIDKIIFGGDAFNGSTTRAGALDKLRLVKERFAPLNVIGLRGNHEYNLNDGGSPEEMLTESEIFSNISDKTKATGVIRPSNDVMYGYLDNEEQKLRYIFLDSKYETDRHELIDDAQLNWMASKMIELDSSWTIIIFSHQFRRKPSDSYMPSGQLIADKLSSINYTATLAAVIYGHAHDDYYHNDLGYLDICTTCDSRQQSGHFNDYAGTVNEHAFDVYAINTANRTIKAVRVGRYSDEVAIREWTY